MGVITVGDVRKEHLAVVVEMAEDHFEEYGVSQDNALNAMQLEAIRDLCRALGRWSRLDG